MAEMWQRKTQAGLEVTRGTAVAATRMVNGESAWVRNPNREIVPEAGMGLGTLISGYETRDGNLEVTGSHSDPLTFEDFPWYLQMGLKGGVAGVQQGATAAYLYTFAPSAAADDVKTATWEWNDGLQGYEMPYTIMNNWSVELGTGETPMFNADLFAQDMTEQALTAALSARTRELVPTRGATFYLDTTGAIGTTALTGTLRSMTVGVNQNFHAKHTMDGTVAFSDVGRGKREVSASFVLEYKRTDEFAALRDGTNVKVRVRLTGSLIAVGYNKFIEFDLYGRWSEGNYADADGNVTRVMTLASLYDSTAGSDIIVRVQNALATLP